MRWATTRSSIIARLRDPHDDDAWRTFDRLYGEVMVRFAINRGLPLDDAEDVRQIVLMSLVRSMPGFDFRRERGRFRSYLGRVVGNAIQRHRTRARPGGECLVADLEPYDPGHKDADTDARWESEWTAWHLRRALHVLRESVTPQSIEIFQRLLDGRTPESVAREADVSVAAVYKVQQRLRARLQAQVRRQIDEEGRALEGLQIQEAS